MGELTPERVEQFEQERVEAGYCRRWARCARLPLRFLREVGVAPEIPATVPADGPVERVLVDYRAYLARERGLAESTVGNYERVARLFLVDCLEVRGLALEELTAADVSGFLGTRVPEAQRFGRQEFGVHAAAAVALSARGRQDPGAAALGGAGGRGPARSLAAARG